MHIYQKYPKSLDVSASTTTPKPENNIDLKVPVMHQRKPNNLGPQSIETRLSWCEI